MWIQTIFGGNIGVRSIAESGFGVQLKVGNNSIIEKSHTIFSPSVSLGEHVKVGTIQTNARQDNGIPLRSQVEFPASAMPPLPFVGAAASLFFIATVETGFCGIYCVGRGLNEPLLHPAIFFLGPPRLPFPNFSPPNVYIIFDENSKYNRQDYKTSNRGEP